MRNNLRKARLGAGLTQSEVARRVGLTRASYTNIERGYKNPSVVTALRIAQVLGRPVEELFADELRTYQAGKRVQKAGREGS
ncbi:MAG: putative transcriptional regulator [Bacillota bacterium]|jgi:putative transcriptional regulator|nr:putative transcriptional regulator [Bacillota bacterium]